MPMEYPEKMVLMVKTVLMARKGRRVCQEPLEPMVKTVHQARMVFLGKRETRDFPASLELMEPKAKPEQLVRLEHLVKMARTVNLD